jgi:hypothetical protein
LSTLTRQEPRLLGAIRPDFPGRVAAVSVAHLTGWSPALRTYFTCAARGKTDAATVKGSDPLVPPTGQAFNSLRRPEDPAVAAETNCQRKSNWLPEEPDSW